MYNLKIIIGSKNRNRVASSNYSNYSLSNVKNIYRYVSIIYKAFMHV
jgi:hypothetical protein